MGSNKRAVKKSPKQQPAKAKKVVTFTEVTTSFTNTVNALVLGLKGRQGGAHNYGADGLFVCAVEALHTARGSRNLEDFLKSAAYAVGAAMKACGAWDYPVAEPEPEEKD